MRADRRRSKTTAPDFCKRAIPLLEKVSLSKSKLISGWQCGKRLWLEKYVPELLEYSPSTEAAFAVGHRVGETAQSLFPEGILIGHDQALSEALRETRQLLEKPGPVTLFEATFQAGGVMIRADILIRDARNRIHLIEVKAATKLKDYYLVDCAIQLWVLEQLGLSVNRLELAHINNQFVYEGEGDYKGLFNHVDVLADAYELQEDVEELIEEMRTILSGDQPDVPMGPQCTDPFDCPFHDHCLGPQPDMPITWLPGGQKVWNPLANAGYEDIREIPEGFLTNELAEKCRQATIQGNFVLDPAAAEELGALGWPRYYFDFETMAPAVPLFTGTRPYQAQAFQWSCHIEHKDGTLEHREFLAEGKAAPMRPCAESLIRALGEVGPIFMYSSYERTVIRGLIGRFADLEEPLERIVSRLYDLHPLTKKYYYHPDMHGSWSIKAVLPTVAPDLDYGELDIISSGEMAEPVFLEMIDERTDPERKEALREALLRYCELDTLAMVRLAHFLEGSQA
jgi:CRISPR/Cas system-associated exonuclease Cas4 (RecB family)